MEFYLADIGAALSVLGEAELDALPFGVIRMTSDGRVDRYNQFESELSGLRKERVIGRHFFTEVAPCTNNFLVASRFEDAATLDELVPYVFTLRMRPRKVELRLVKSGADYQFILVRDR